MLRRLWLGGVLMAGAVMVGALAVALSACGGSNSVNSALQEQADRFLIGEIEKDFHESMTKQDIEQMMSLWAPNATVTIGPGRTATGTGEIREAWMTSTPFQPETNWVSDHPAYKAPRHDRRRPRHAVLRVPLRRREDEGSCSGHRRGHGRRAGRRSLADHQDGRRHNRAEALSRDGTRRSATADADRTPRRRLLSSVSDPLVRAVGRAAGQRPHQAARRLRGHRAAGRRGRRPRTPPPRAVERAGGGARGAPGTSFAYGKLQSDATHVRLLLSGERRQRLLQGLDREPRRS